MAGRRVTLYVPAALDRRARATIPDDVSWSKLLQERLEVECDAIDARQEAPQAPEQREAG